MDCNSRHELLESDIVQAFQAMPKWLLPKLLRQLNYIHSEELT